MSNENWNERADWVQYGMAKGWVSDSYCATHDGGYEYMTDDEREQWEEGGDPCQIVLRVLEVD
jgi:hypothetical protein